MPTYPTSIPVAVGSGLQFDTDRQIERASNGAARGRVFYTAPKRRFRLEHTALGVAEQDVVMDFYDDNLASSFDFVWPLGGNTYTCIFAAEPVYKPLGAFLATLTVELVEV